MAMAMPVAHDMGTAPEPHHYEKERAPEQEIEIGWHRKTPALKDMGGCLSGNQIDGILASREASLIASETTYSIAASNWSNGMVAKVV